VDSTTWNELQEIFEQALPLNEEERNRLLDRAFSSRPEVRDQMLRLLAANEQSAEFLATPLPRQLEQLTVGSRIGAWKITDFIGSGGMGLVYRCERADGVYEQAAALKLMRPEHADHLASERFAAERRLLARLDHPNIARLLDGGFTPYGQPYLVMEFVDGKPLDQFCDLTSMSLRARVRLILAVCDAISYLHQNLVIHGDLKPANILVTCQRWVKVLDFGTARLVEPADGVPVLTDSVRQLTPAFASPEQLRGLPLTTRSDVYSLGVILYRMLTGGLPFDFSSSRMAEIEASIYEPDPRLPKSVDRDLAAVTLKCLCKDPDKRYATVDHVSAELKRWLDELPVDARRESRLYRLGMFLKRHRTATLAIAMILLSAAAGFVSTWRQERIAKENLRTLHEISTALLVELPESPGSVTSMRRRVERQRRIIRHLDQLAAVSSRTVMQEELIAAYHAAADFLRESGEMRAAIAAHESGIALAQLQYKRRPAEATRRLLGYSLLRTASTLRYLGEDRRALPVIREGLGLLPDLPTGTREQQSALVVARHQLGELELNRGHYAEAGRQFLDALPAARNIQDGGELLGTSLAWLARLAAVEKDSGAHARYCAEAVRVFTASSRVRVECMAESRPSIDALRQNVAYHEGLFVLDPDNHSSRLGLWNAWHQLGQALEKRQTSRQAYAAYRKSEQVIRAEHKRVPENRRVARYVALSLEGMARLEPGQGAVIQALEHLRSAVRLREALVSTDPEDRFLAKELALAMARLTRLERNLR
jgi:serine/threonine protein kinase